MKQAFENRPMPESINALVHLGAGRCKELDEYTVREPQSILLVEADPQLAQALAERCAALTQVRVITAAVSGQPGSATFYRYNLPDVGSLHQANGALLERYPGLQKRAEIAVTSVDPSSLIEPLKLQTDQENLLIVDVPGEELPVLQALQRTGQLQVFRHVQLYCSQQPLYEGSTGAAQALQWLREQGFDLVAEDDSEDPDRPCWILQRNTLLLNFRELQENYTQLAQAHDQQAKLAEERQAQIDELTKARDHQARLAEERQAQINELTKARDGQAKLAEQRQAQINGLTQARDQQAKLAEERQAQIEQLTKSREDNARFASDMQQRVEELNAQLSLSQAESESLASSEKSLKNELDEARQTAALSVKLQTLREADLEDLQQRYKKALETQDNQHKLLVKLSDRLSVASVYFHRLANHGGMEQVKKKNKKKKKKKRMKKIAVGELMLNKGDY